MLNLNELESNWLKYKIKSIIPYAVILISSIIILTIASIYFFTPATIDSPNNLNKTTNISNASPNIKEISQKNIKVEPKNIKKVVVIEKNTPEIKPIQIQKVLKTTTKTVLSPSLDFMINIRGNTLPYIETNDTENSSVKTATNTKLVNPKKNVPIVIENIQEQEEVTKANSIQIDRQNTHDDIEHVIKRFKKNNNPALSLFIAKKYYQLGEYHQAYNYSLMTNEINNDIEASWIIFAKSLVKLNEKSMAIKTLTQYIEHSHSNRAQRLLNEIQSGKFQ